MHNHIALRSIDPSLFAYLTPEEESKLCQATGAVSPSEVTALITDVLSQAPFTSPFWSDHGPSSKQWPVVALRAYLDGQISKTVFVATCMLAGCCAEFGHNKKAFSFEDDHTTVSVQVRDATKKPAPGTKLFRPIGPDDSDYQKYFQIFAQVFLLDEQQALLASMKGLPLHDQTLFVINLPIGPISSWSPLFHVLNRALERYSGFFTVTEEGNQGLECWSREWVMTSIAVYQLYLDLFGALDCLKQQLVPVLGSLTERDIANHQARFERVIGIGISDLTPMPRKADNRDAGEVTFTIHDIYHGFKNQLRGFREWVAVSRMVYLLFSLSDREQTPNSMELRGAIIDAESLATSSRAKTIVPFGYFFQRDRFKTLWEANPKAKDLIFQDMVDHPHFWEGLFANERLGLHQDERDLLEVLKSIPSHAAHTPCPLVLDEHFGLPLGFIEEMEGYVAKPADQKIAMQDLISALHMIHYRREQALKNIRHLSGCQWRNAFSYKELARLLAMESEERFLYFIPKPLEVIKRYVNFPERLSSLSLVNQCLALPSQDQETLRLINTYLEMSDLALGSLVQKFTSPLFAKHVAQILPVLCSSLPFLLDTNILQAENPPLFDLLLRHQNKIPKRCGQLLGQCLFSLPDGPIPFLAYPVDGEYYFIAEGLESRLEYLGRCLTACSRSGTPFDVNIITETLSCSDDEFVHLSENNIAGNGDAKQ